MSTPEFESESTQPTDDGNWLGAENEMMTALLLFKILLFTF